ncbi:tumor necrosis factor receptor superfamily member 1A isoform X2 [Equus caballus]|uniref:tumor necrosis factor receptor superfamily member 1A isoform X2 n=1 Tax=Equus caballus TaxID=9796 RepID=UPI0038B25EB9
MSPCGLLLLLLLLGRVTTASSVTECGPDEYEAEGLHMCCKLCPAGSYVSEHCTVNHSKGQCRECEPGTFTAHPTGMTSCLPCAQCREDQEVVTNCSRVSDRRCQCQQGSFYCDSPDCAEKCFRCTRCQGSVLQPCSATRDTVCAVETNQEPDERLTPSLQGNRNSSEPFIAVAVAVAVAVVVVVVLLIVFIIVVYQKKGVQIRRWVVGCLKRESEEPGSPPPARSQSDDALLPPDPERDPSAAGVETERELEEESLALDPGAGSCPGLSEDPEESIELQEYEQTYFLKDTSSKTTSQTYYIFGQEVTPSKWNMFMTLIGLEGNEIERCRYENQGNLIEVHHEMLVMWRSKLGREASIFKLMAALHQMQLRTCLENIINKLIAENILAKHAETPN